GERFRTVSGRGFRPRRAALGPWKPLATALVAALFLVMSLPILMIVWTSLLGSYATPSLAGLANLTLDNYARALSSPFATQAIGNTILLVLFTATGAMLLGALVAWFAVRDGGPIGRALEVISFAPTAIPPIVMVIAILLV